jgi:hypothetical protein
MEKKFVEDLQSGLNLSAKLITEIKVAIQVKNLDTLDKLLFKIPLKNIDYATTTNLLIILLDHFELYEFPEGLKKVLKYWSGMETGFDEYEGELYPVIPTLFLDFRIPFRSLYLIMDTLKSVLSVEEVAIDIFEKGTEQNTTRALRNLFDMFPNISGETFRLLTDEAIAMQNESAIEFMSSLQGYYTLPVKKPDYVFADEGEELPEETDLISAAEVAADEIKGQDMEKFTSLENCVDFLTLGFTKYGIEFVDMDEAKKALREKLEPMSEQTRLAYMSSFLTQESMESLNKEETLFQILGPANPILNGDYTQMDHICYKFGGCRMLYCNCYEIELQLQIDDQSLPYYPNIPQWFKGQCEQCNRVIPKRCYSVRRPLPQGGWMGTYCSWNCLQLSGRVDDDLSIAYSDKFENELSQFGLTDRQEMNVEEEMEKAKEENPEGYLYKPPIIN